MYYPSLEEVRNYAAEYNCIPVYREILADLETPVSAFMKIRNGNYSFLLESVEGGQKIARYSFIGTEPYRVLKAESGSPEDILVETEEELSRFSIPPIFSLPRFCGGAVGYMGYETVTAFEKLPLPDSDELNVPQAMLMFFDTFLVFDHVTRTLRIMSYAHIEDDVKNAYNEAITRIEKLAERLNKPLPEISAVPPEHSSNSSSMSSNCTSESFQDMVIKAKEYIRRGDAIQVVLSQRLSRPYSADPLSLYRSLRTINPSPYMYFLDLGDFQIAGASPEILVRKEGSSVMTRPLAGTRTRGATPAQDRQLELELKSDEKERAEHIMLVDLGRNDIGRVSEPGTVKVSELMDVERYSHVMHLVTHVQGTIRGNLTGFDALRACFPAGTVSGAPKIRAMEIIAELENTRRGPYAGAVGYFSLNGDMDMAIAIRTFVIKKGIAYAQAGCGIVYDSVPETEYKETLSKVRALVRALEYSEQNHGTGGNYAAAHR